MRLRRDSLRMQSSSSIATAEASCNYGTSNAKLGYPSDLRDYCKANNRVIAAMKAGTVYSIDFNNC
jgi:hypothetical protein